MLSKALDSYLAVRHAAGFELGVPEILLRSFVRFAEAQGELHVIAQSAINWAALAPSLGQREHRLKTVVRFARHAQAEDPRHQVPPTDVFGHHRQRRVPYIFSQTEISRLMQQAARLAPTGSLRPHMYSTLIGLLASTGLRVSEALALRLEDVTADGLVIGNTKFKKSRLVPLHPSTRTALEHYLIRRQCVGGADDHVFITLRGQRVRYYTVYETFRALLGAIGIHARPGAPRPCIHSLRHTFAVRALEGCPDGRDRISQHMLALSTYLGHAHTADTYWYLEASPQLMTDIAGACENLIKGQTP